MSTATRSFARYRSGELEVILSTIPTHDNIRHLSEVLSRSEPAIRIVFRIAYGSGPFAQSAKAQRRKIAEAKRRLGLGIN